MGDAHEKLAQVLFETLERLDPGHDMRHWDKMGNWGQALYINRVERLLEERQLIKCALEGACDDSIDGSSNKRE
jgi:hypothetical protein